MSLIVLVILVAALLCSLVAGFLFCFAVVVMPGIRNLGDLGFLQSFKAMDRVIQNNQPIFMLVWIGSVVALIGATVLGLWQLEGLDRILLIVACAIYLLGVQFPTGIVNVPLNNQLQSQQLDTMSTPELQETRAQFETRWVRWNAVRTVFAILTTALLLVLLSRR